MAGARHFRLQASVCQVKKVANDFLRFHFACLFRLHRIVIGIADIQHSNCCHLGSCHQPVSCKSLWLLASSTGHQMHSLGRVKKEWLTSPPSPLHSPASRHEHRPPSVACENAERRLLINGVMGPKNSKETREKLHLRTCEEADAAGVRELTTFACGARRRGSTAAAMFAGANIYE